MNTTKAKEPKVSVTFNISIHGREILKNMHEKLKEFSYGEILERVLTYVLRGKEELNAYEYSHLLLARPRKQSHGKGGAPSFYPKTRGTTTGVYMRPESARKLDALALELQMSRGDCVDLLLREFNRLVGGIHG